MRKWRVGTLSLGILMIALGMAMLAAQLRQVGILDILLAWWPLILVLIGAEILVQVYINRDERPQIQYDIFSIIIILIMMFFSIGMLALTSTGIIEGIAWMVESSAVPVDISPERISVDESMEKIVVSVSGGRLDVRESTTAEVVVFGEATVNAAGNEEALALAEQYRATTRREGGILFVQLSSAAWSGDFKPGIRDLRYTLLIPQGTRVEINGPGYFNLDVEGEALGGEWLIKGGGSVKITLAKPSNLFIDAQIRGGGSFGGNANWEIEEKPDSFTDRGPEYEGYLRWGEGAGKVNIILDSGEIVVNEI